MISPGTYKARGMDAALSTTKSGREQVGVRFELVDHPGETIIWYGYFTDGTFERTIKSLRACGWRGDDLSDLSGIGAMEVQIVVEHEEYNGKTRAKVRWVNGAGSGGIPNQLAADKAKSFAERMRESVAEIGGDDDIPF